MRTQESAAFKTGFSHCSQESCVFEQIFRQIREPTSEQEAHMFVTGFVTTAILKPA